MKKKIIIIVSLVCVLLLMGGLSYYFLTKNNDREVNNVTADALKFKEEYESLNNTTRESDGALYNNIDISENNPIKYVNTKEALEVLKNKTAILYVGANWCPWCRNAVPVLFEVAKSYNVKTIYYLNLDEEKDVYEVKNGKLEKTAQGTEGYYELLEFLDSELEDYIITSNGKDYNTGEKRIYMPFVAVSKNGEVKGSHTGTVKLDENQTKYDPLTEEQYKTLKKDYEDLFSKIYANGVCNNACD